jgi:acetylornithine/succinyldiaminopimelate/putrescine aminotransferase/predicted amino acid dehydrogenase
MVSSAGDSPFDVSLSQSHGLPADAPLLNPERLRLTNLVRFDKTIVRASGSLLYDDEGNEYLDFGSQYGALPFGHNPEFLWEALEAVRRAGGPSFVQPMRSPAAEALARRLLDAAPPGLRHVVFTTSGAECTEVAIKVARARTRRSVILAADNGFHGKTLGAASATGNPIYREPFLADTTAFEHVPYDDLPRLEARLARGDVAAFIVEPVQGEGGVVVPARGYLAAARALCARWGALFVLDEVQTGLGRTGRLFAAEWEQVAPDVLLTAKALGGGLVPLGACLITGDAWTAAFGLHHSATFANNHLTCSVGLAVLERLCAEERALLENVRSVGAYLRERLDALVRDHPKAFRRASGIGLMQGLELASWSSDDSYFPRIASGSGYAVPIVCGFLLNVHRIVALPTMSKRDVLRIQPALTVQREHVDRLSYALEHAGALISRGDFAELIRYVVDASPGKSAPPPPTNADVNGAASLQAPNIGVNGDREPPSSARIDDVKLGTFAFLMHPTVFDDLVDGMPSACAAYPPEQRSALRAWVERFRRLERSPRAVHHVRRIRSKEGGYVDGWLIYAPLTPHEMLRLKSTERRRLMAEYFSIARDRGATMIGLGAFTSVITRGGTEAPDTAIPLTTGNSLTALSCSQSARGVARRAGLRLAECTAAVIGAAGSTGRLVALDLAPHCGRLLLFGNPANPTAERDLRAVADEIGAAGTRDQGAVRVCANLAESLPEAALVVSATSNGRAMIRPEWLAPNAIVCDAARPSDVGPEVARLRPDVIVYEGGLCALHSTVRFGGRNVLGFPAGVNLGCLSETIALAMARVNRSFSLGKHIPIGDAYEVLRLAQAHGFEPYTPPSAVR